MRIKLDSSAAIVILLGSALSVTSCGGSGGTAAAGGGPAGTVTSADSLASVSMPANDGIKTGQVTITPSTGTVPGSPDYVAATSYDFGPSGTSFPQPVQLSITYNTTKIPTGGTEAGLGLFVVSNGAWTLVPNSLVDTVNKKVTAPVSHFSSYGLLCVSPFAGTWTGTVHSTPQFSFQLTVGKDGNAKVTGTDPTSGALIANGSVTLGGTLTVSGTDASTTAITITGQLMASSNGLVVTGSGNSHAVESNGVIDDVNWTIP